MTVLIIEDEPRAAERLCKMVEEIMPDAIIPPALESVEESIEWLNSNPDPEIVLMDIELADGKSFSILQKCQLKSKVIFCTAFDQYALQAFQHQGMAYLLKPVKFDELKAALEKAGNANPKIDYDQLVEAMERRDHRYQKRILVRLGKRYKAIPVDEIAYIYTEAKNVLIMTNEGKDIPVDQTMEQLETLLNPDHFFRINRKIIVNIGAIDNMYAWSRSRLKLELAPNTGLEAIVATERASGFKEWLEGRRTF